MDISSKIKTVMVLACVTLQIYGSQKSSSLPPDNDPISAKVSVLTNPYSVDEYDRLAVLLKIKPKNSEPFFSSIPVKDISDVPTLAKIDKTYYLLTLQEKKDIVLNKIRKDLQEMRLTSAANFKSSTGTFITFNDNFDPIEISKK
ncbi:MAG TPA: hypothetical protein VEK38_03260 [Candidatus Bathyarchaeia archaeon]|nr:hypothetical protein [Candidatus Bathyarchaeia archaeon]